ncbi:3-deoxy-D-manno-octulosonic acid transferase [Mucilaginibacter sp. UR6-11]|uniref:3-deoxy-D-manno-octulosonic acid transferase n=1 Tax=Mucilaginibacter sp. UR6-11 TaxID=1435644 RepID=UPI001E53A5FB|nr:glycosyltransferase N-terminal domain-containing protein [Mucilaginibacter sp. UR6-11]MCC8425430.1 3-deoxy-D-manno-octulosonic acid transferase [Mucilaginibacter sp. UR6-11]
MLLLYNLGLRIYYTLILLFSAFNSKARLWITGRQHVKYTAFNQSVWFHFASLGEFEQGRPVLERFRAMQSQSKIVVTFFSPSGYEIRKNTPLADAVYYLPLDTAQNAQEFINTVNPALAIFTKYEYWYHFFNELNKRRIPLYIISGIFRPEQVFFKWYGGLHRKMLSFVSHFFVQDEESKHLLQSLNINNVSVSGDTRFDRVWANAQQPKDLSAISGFKDGQKLFIAGSTWPADERLIAGLITQYPDWKFIIAPHEISEEKINNLTGLLPQNAAQRYSKLTAQNPPLTTQVLIIDNIGMLSSLYQYADIAFIGGGFGAGIHNTLEAAAVGLPVIFGPNYNKFKEAKDLIKLGAGFSVSDEAGLKKVVADLIGNETHYAAATNKAKTYVAEHTGATDAIVNYIAYS